MRPRYAGPQETNVEPGARASACYPIREQENDTRKWSFALPSGTLMVAGDKVMIASAGRLTALSRTGGSTLGHVELSTNGKPMLDGVIAAENSLFVATTDGEIVCLAAQ